jgi:hypothetical protein
MADELERALLLRDLELMGQPRNPNAVQPGRAGLLDVGVGLPERLSLLNQIFNPVEAIGQSMNAGGRMMSPNMGVMDRLAALGDMASGIAGVVAPVAAASRAGTPAATALMEGLLGGSPDEIARFAADEAGSLPGMGIGLPTPRTDAEAMARDILQLRAEGRAGEVTDQMRAAADPQYMYFNTPLPMDYASRMARADQYFPDTAYHSTGKNFQEFIPSEFRGASFFGPTPEGAARGASASANEGVGSGSTITMPVRVDTSRVEGLGAYGRQDMNEFRASLPDRIYTEAEVDALMASDTAPRYGNWTYFFDDLTDYDALSKFRDANPDAPIPEGIIKYKPKQPLSYGPGLRSDISGKQFAHYSEGMSERPISDYTKSIGNTGFTMMDESGLALAMTDPTRIRSRFALFDPEFAHLRNLSASLATAGVPLGLLSMSPEEEQY